MEETYELLVNIIIPALVTTLLGLAVPALNEKRKQLNRTNSVFTLALSRHKYKIGARA